MKKKFKQENNKVFLNLKIEVQLQGGANFQTFQFQKFVLAVKQFEELESPDVNLDTDSLGFLFTLKFTLALFYTFKDKLSLTAFFFFLITRDIFSVLF